MSTVDQARANPDTRKVLSIAWPLAIKATMLHGIVVVDAYLVSALGENSLVSLGLASALAGIILGFLFSFSSATQIRIAQAFGTGENVRLKTSLMCGLAINLVLVTVGFILLRNFASDILQRFAPTPEIAENAQAYLSALSVVFLGEAVSLCLSAFFNGCGKTRIPLISYAISLPINIFISWILIHGLFGMPEMGVVGAAIGTSVASVLRLVFLLGAVWHQSLEIVSAKGWQQGRFSAALRRHFAFTLPIAATFVSMSIANQICLLIYAQMSIADFAAMTLILPWIQVAGTVSMSWAQATGILVAQMLGQTTAEDRLDQFLSRAWKGVFFAAGLTSVFLVGICVFAGLIYSNIQQTTIAALFSFWPVLLILPALKCTNAICGNTLRAAGDTVYVMNLFIGAQWLFRVPLTFVFVTYFGVSAFWVLSLILMEEIVKFPWFHRRIFSGQWKRSTSAID